MNQVERERLIDMYDPDWDKPQEEIMNLCDAGHEEVCFEGRNCPACALKDEILERDKKITNLEMEVYDLENREE